MFYCLVPWSCLGYMCDVAPINLFWDALPNLNYAIVLFYVTLARVSNPMRIKINFMYVYKYFG